jgi:hypothetical protein
MSFSKFWENRKKEVRKANEVIKEEPMLAGVLTTYAAIGVTALASPVYLAAGGVFKGLQKIEEHKARTSENNSAQHTAKAQSSGKNASECIRTAVASAGGPATLVFYAIVEADVLRENSKKSKGYKKIIDDSTPIASQTNAAKYGATRTNSSSSINAATR